MHKDIQAPQFCYILIFYTKEIGSNLMPVSEESVNKAQSTGSPAVRAGL